MRRNLQVVMRNLQHAAYDSTPGTLVNDYGPHGEGPLGQSTRAITEEEAAQKRQHFERLATELRERDPGTYEAWLSDFEFWRSGDVTVQMPRPEDYTRREDGLICFNEHRLTNTRETVPFFDDGMAFAFLCRRCGTRTHLAGFIGTPCRPANRHPDRKGI